MKMKGLALAGVLLIMAISSFVSPVSGDGNEISYTDPAGDYSNDGMDETRRNNIDITSVSVDFSSDPIVLELTVVGTIDYTDTDYNYIYTISLDHDGDADEETEVEITKYGLFFTSDYGIETASLSTEVSGSGTSTLHVELPASYIAGHPGILDVLGEAEVDDIWNSADDIVNEDFQGSGGVPGDDDDDDTEPTLYLPENEDPDDATPTDPSINIDIDDFDFTFTLTETTYTMTQEASGDGDLDIFSCAFALVYYDKLGGSVNAPWEEGPVDDSGAFGSMSYEERFRGTGSGNTWESWEWYFMSSGPSDTSEIQQYKGDSSSYWDGLDRIVLYVRAFDDVGQWNQASMDITNEFKSGIVSGDDDDDDDTTPADEDDDGGDDSPGFELFLILPMLVIIVGISIYRRKRN